LVRTQGCAFLLHTSVARAKGDLDPVTGYLDVFFVVRQLQVFFSYRPPLPLNSQQITHAIMVLLFRPFPNVHHHNRANSALRFLQLSRHMFQVGYWKLGLWDLPFRDMLSLNHYVQIRGVTVRRQHSGFGQGYGHERCAGDSGDLCVIRYNASSMAPGQVDLTEAGPRALARVCACSQIGHCRGNTEIGAFATDLDILLAFLAFILNFRGNHKIATIISGLG
jgi:hypothetical protein